ncbi:MAG: hypothetical protein QXY49_01945 [Thermofilaceae archaeon]
MLVLRALIFESDELRSISTLAKRMESWGQREREVKVVLHIKRITRVGLIVQELPNTQACILWEPVLSIETVKSGKICRYHDNCGDASYCHRPAVTEEGYCSIHRDSWRALYELCAQGVEEACEKAAERADEEFTVYALDFGGRKLKIGLTQSWRLLYRLAEQPHASAALLFKGSLLQARDLERRLGRRKRATEGVGIGLSERLKSSCELLSSNDPFPIASRLAVALAELGLDGVFDAFTILPRFFKLELFSQFTSIELRELLGRRLKLCDYWAGLLVLRDQDSGELLILNKNEALHKPVKATVTESRSGEGGLTTARSAGMV